MSSKSTFPDTADILPFILLTRWQTMSSVARATMAVAFFLTALALRFAILPVDRGAPFVTFYPAVMLSCLLLGMGPGLLTLALSMAATEYIFLAPQWSFRLDGDQPLPLLIFALSGVLICTVTHQARRYAERLREGERRYRSVVEDQTEVICRMKADGTLVFVNDVYCRFFGRSVSELIGSRWHPIAYAPDVPSVEARLRTLSPNNPVVTIENRVYTAQGELKWMQFVNRAFFDASGQLDEIQAVGRDIDDRKAMEEKLETSNERLQFVLEGSGDGLWDWDLRTGVAYLSPTYFEITGYRPEEVTPDIEFFKRTVHPEDLPRVLHVMNAHLEGKTPTSEFDYRLVARSGEIKWMAGRGRVVERGSNGEPIRMAGTITDISQRKRTETALRDAQEQLEMRVAERTEQLRELAVQATLAEEKERQSIARDLHDDIGQLLHISKIKLDELGESVPGEIQAKVAELDGLIADASRRVRSLTSQISPPILHDFGLVPALNWLCDDMERNYGLDVDRELGDLSIALSEAQSSILFRAARELLINVAKHADADTVRIELSCRMGLLRLSVIDDGIGFRTVPVTAAANGGFGLFSVCERITFLGGTMSMETQEGGGARVDLVLPIVPSQDVSGEKNE